MFVRKKRNKSGSVSVQVIDKAKGYRVIKTIGSGRTPEEIGRLVELGEVFIARQSSQYSLFPKDERDNAVVLDFVRTLGNSSVRTVGPELVFGRLFDEIGFGAIPERLFRDIVVSRLVHPGSKMKTVDYLYRYQGRSVSVDSVYLFLDRLNRSYSKQAKEVAYRHSLKILKRISMVFYDMTSLYFEAEDEDDLRRIGFSKDGKFQNPQIMLGLLVSENGYPIGYDIFEGNTFEGKTLMPVLRKIRRAYGLVDPVVVADAAMLSQDNLDALGQEKYPFIVAARIRNETVAMQEQILQRCGDLANAQSVVFEKEDGRRLIVTYSEARAKKDRRNRERGLRRLRKRVASGRLAKERINNRGYNKFLKLEGEVCVEIDEQKVLQDIRWDGLKGYLTNTGLSPDEVIGHYGQLWHIERAFRISKSDLRVRPIYHRLRRRIEAHILIAFVAYAIYKELERRLIEAAIPFSPKRAAELTQTMYEISFSLPNDPQQHRVLLQMDQELRQLYELLH